MGFISELRLRARHVVGPVLGVCVIVYFTFHAFRGDRGVLALRQMSQRVEVARLQYEEIKARRMELEHRVRLLHPNSLDPDMLDERARLMLNYGHEDDVVVIPDIHVILDHQNGQSGR